MNMEPAQIVRRIGDGERVTDLIHELAQRTYDSNGMEHGIISLRSGDRVIVRGGVGGIELTPLLADLRRVILHTHPTTTGPSASDFAMLEQTRQRSSWIYELFGGGLQKFSR